ncbi:uncharacterized protein LOC142517851 [Primulina tabacum]|uniref:uncharacterized protein LOC142517851 n=1 Tax=Primulina tabacum TaxID=48773 RepID=UPI003F59B509
MEGFGSRQSRASSRYGSSSATPVFSGPVRKWKKQWVSSRPTNTSGKNCNDGPPLLLCRWTPLSTAADETRKRRFRYTPIVPIQKGDTESVEKLMNEDKLNERNQTRGFRNGSDASNGDISTEETQELSEDQSDSNKNAGDGLFSKEKKKNDH